MLFILFIDIIAWILWVITSQIGNRATVGLFKLIHLLDFIVDGASGFLRYIYVKGFIDPIIIVASLVLPQYAYKEYSVYSVYLYKIYGEIDRKIPPNFWMLIKYYYMVLLFICAYHVIY